MIDVNTMRKQTGNSAKINCWFLFLSLGNFAFCGICMSQQQMHWNLDWKFRSNYLLYFTFIVISLCFFLILINEISLLLKKVRYVCSFLLTLTLNFYCGKLDITAIAMKASAFKIKSVLSFCCHCCAVLCVCLLKK